MEIVVVELTGSETLAVYKGGSTEMDWVFSVRIMDNNDDTYSDSSNLRL